MTPGDRMKEALTAARFGDDQTRCDTCGQVLEVGMYPFCNGVSGHGRGTSRIAGDECDYIDYNLGKEPVHITSWSQRRALMDAAGLEDACRYVPPPDGAEPNPQAPSNWAARTDTYTMNNVRILMERAFGQRAVEVEDEGALHNVRTWIGDSPNG